jgi:outer membrane biosynthesis protein TonB
MVRLTPLLIAFALGLASAAALASCGGGNGAELLPGTTAEQIESNLDQVDELANSGDCIGAEDAVAEVTAEIEDLEGVDLKLKAALQEGTARLSEVVSRCEEETTSEETEPTTETDVGNEEVEKEKKPKKEKPEKETPEPKEESPESEGPNLPPQSNGKGEENGQGGGESSPESGSEETPSSGGVGPGVGVE